MDVPADPPVLIRHASLTDVRNYEQLEVQIEPGINAFVGPNGQGKTNLVEAIAYLSVLGSHRVATDAPLVRHGADQAVIRVDVAREERTLLLEIEISSNRANRARINRAPVAKTRDILGILRTVVFAPEDLALVKGDPSERRRFLDDLLVQRQPRLAGTRLDYDRVLKQRNALLKSAAAARRSHSEDVIRTLEAWDDQLARLGAEIIVARRELTSVISPLATDAYQALVPGYDSIELRYRSVVDDAGATDVTAALLEEMARRRTEELDRGVTLVGPHRDDLDVTLGSRPLKGFASHGESWSAALSLRLGAYDLLTKESAAPVLVLDDVFAELDARRRAHLSERVAQAPQVLITAAAAEDVPAAMSCTWYDVLSGMVRRRD